MSSISFSVNGTQHEVKNVDPLMTLNSWLRKQPGLNGTKIMCGEGGCGCCVVALLKPNEKTKAVNSCLLPICSIDGCQVTTVEGLGSRRDGFNDIQSRLADFGGSQCGYCSPGFVMSMHSLLENENQPTQQEVVDNFDGHICRCTGYRPILDAMKSFASDADPSILQQCKDIEDLGKCEKKCKEGCKKVLQQLAVKSESTAWNRPLNLKQLQNAIKQGTNYRLVCGNTSTGIYKIETPPPLFIDITVVSELKQIEVKDEEIVFGANTTLLELIETFKQVGDGSDMFSQMADHIARVATVPVRNIGSWAGNVMTKFNHRDFPSDICTLIDAVGATIKVYDLNTSEYTDLMVTDFFNASMVGKIIFSMTIPRPNPQKNVKFSSFKVTPRWQNAHAYVNAAFTADILDGKINAVSLVYGGVPSFSHATKTEQFLAGKAINEESLQESLQTLSGELTPINSRDHFDSFDMVEFDSYAHNLALGLFYKFFLTLCPSLPPAMESAIQAITRGVNSSKQTFSTDPSTYPVSKKLPKQAAILQTSGEAVYVSDHAPTGGELCCTLVLAEVGNADIDDIITAAANQMEGFVAIIKAADIPEGFKNTFVAQSDPTLPILADGHVKYAGQPVAIAIADSYPHAHAIASAVQVTYKNEKKPIIRIEDAIAESSFFDGLAMPDFVTGDPDTALKNAKHVVSGKMETGFQYHFYMETQVAVATPTEEGGFEVDMGTQGQTGVQSAISYALNIPANKIEIRTKQMGGGFGGKSSNSQMTACVAALASYVTRRPVRFHADLKTCMSVLGTRAPFYVEYQVGFSSDGILEAINYKLFQNSGCSINDSDLSDSEAVTLWGDSAYYCPNRKYVAKICRTNTPSTTWCRSPTSVQMTAFADLVMEHVAHYLNQDPIAIKSKNFYKDGQLALNGHKLENCNLGKVYDKLMTSAGITDRQQSIKSFNDANKWKKKGIAVTPMKYGVGYEWARYQVMISIYASDGSVVVSHGGIEMGQGINIKVAQVVAYTLGVDINNIVIQRTCSLTSANSSTSGGSITSELACKSAIGCAKILNERVDPIRNLMPPDSSWQNIIARCFQADVELSATFMDATIEGGMYYSYGAAATEVEYDVITGENKIARVDIMYDCGQSLNPCVDIGQVEGAFVMGLGYWLTEQMKYDQKTGKLITDGTWTYKPPMSKDIPEVWNIELLKDTPCPLGVLRSKASGEPPLCTSVSAAIALKHAVEATKRDRGMTEYIEIPAHSTVENLHIMSKLDPLKDFTLG